MNLELWSEIRYLREKQDRHQDTVNRLISYIIQLSEQTPVSYASQVNSSAIARLSLIDYPVKQMFRIIFFRTKRYKLARNGQLLRPLLMVKTISIQFIKAYVRRKTGRQFCCEIIETRSRLSVVTPSRHSQEVVSKNLHIQKINSSSS